MQVMHRINDSFELKQW